LHLALTMPAADQRDRMRLMRGLVREFNVYRWAGRMLLDAVLRQAGPVRVIFDYKILDSDSRAVLISGTTQHAVVGRNGRPRRLSESMQALLDRGRQSDAETP